YDRDDVLYGSVHVDPGAGWFPHVVGYAAETGAGAGLGGTRNLPLAPGSDDGPWLESVRDLVGWVVDAGCEALVVSLGVDAAAAGFVGVRGSLVPGDDPGELATSDLVAADDDRPLVGPLHRELPRR